MPSVVPTLELEQELAAQGFDAIVGFDEVGRGSLAGPVMVGCVAIWARDLPKLQVPAHVADSKMLTARRRENMLEDLENWVAAWAVGQASNHEIDEWGISHALGIAALRALTHVELQLGARGSQVPDETQIAAHGKLDLATAASSATVSALRAGEETAAAADASADGLPLRIGAILDGPYDYITKAVSTFEAPDVPIPPHVVTKVKGDQHCATVASAAVIAKVIRDHLMMQLAERPEYAPYQWASNKGYGSKAHREAIAAYGPCDLHRITWKLS
ncbi:ribonuclease HII [Bifidobacterium dolichotidis]|uniref:Ribonuclease n=1 Tax=Bifidobacterium dolichotidis TaxID=2306976 RepID=A0A430FQG8_9BIFI|nr:ribonuclease HII [Bifidobacterium dolichotidis]RSX55070.1 ribonuclease HII [Bifidobacterium dolichotidis]